MQLSFFTELPGPSLARLLSADVLAALVRLRARVAVGTVELNEPTAEALRTLDAAHVPVTAWLLLERVDGYFPNALNGAAALARLDALLSLRAAHGLTFDTVGLDVEPPLPEVLAALTRPVRQALRWRRRRALGSADADYATLAARVREAGLALERYVLPMSLDERDAADRGWTERLALAPLRDGPAIPMLYTSLMGPAGAALLDAYAPGAQVVGLGSTGGGLDDEPKLSWERLEQDLRVVAAHGRDARLFSLEGCVAQGFLPKLEALLANGPTPLRPSAATRVAGRLLRRLSRTLAR